LNSGFSVQNPLKKAIINEIHFVGKNSWLEIFVFNVSEQRTILWTVMSRFTVFLWTKKPHCAVLTTQCCCRSHLAIQVRRVVKPRTDENNQNVGLNGNKSEKNQIFWEYENFWHWMMDQIMKLSVILTLFNWMTSKSGRWNNVILSLKIQLKQIHPFPNSKFLDQIKTPESVLNNATNHLSEWTSSNSYF
jgi:hypothetical protein